MPKTGISLPYEEVLHGDLKGIDCGRTARTWSRDLDRIKTRDLLRQEHERREAGLEGSVD
ncbi:hypothetical protein A3D62_01060 [Candidatus Kaiserbacteria bacterium RIFCSPHIGHO2_02_FULL_49_11]|uniref:Uncharacterized protein n=1 Tax=Candidatus Kaiserbacteria bacterium RIFCSPHIGHO2_02_FULL_49_11 TaxID=1798489 RepID=A0A1F6D0X4_9BACT|nr:MAG: hypothetical protein A3D62_01060 [Candidatus Kaiserbacteria bacterium RIFCSPHIGHO2_02_FULL_49_11]